MGLISITTPNDGETIDASDVSTPLNTIVNEVNGNLDSNNISSLNGSKLVNASVPGTKLDADFAGGWIATGGTHSVATGYNAGNRSFTIDTSTDVSGFVSEGMRYKVTRGTTPPTQCADLESGSSQYASKSSPTGISFTTTYTAEAWIKLESYGTMGLVSQYNGTSGWDMILNSSGQLIARAFNAGNQDNVSTYQSIPLNKWVHVAVALNVAGATGATYIDGVSVPNTYTNGASASLVQAGNLAVGATNSTNFFDGKIADVRVWSDIRTAIEIKDNMFAYPSDTTGLVAHFKLNGNFTDATGSNDLTASGGALATNADNPWNATEYGIITAVSASDIQVFCPEGYGIPNETLTAPFYSTQDCPFGFPRDKGKWRVIVAGGWGKSSSFSTSYSQHSGGEISVPVGAWRVGLNASIYVRATGVTEAYGRAALSTSTSAVSDDDLKTESATAAASGSQVHANQTSLEKDINLTSTTKYYLISAMNSTSGVTHHVVGNAGSGTDTGGRIFADCAYL